jgi:hypothetical protein
MNQKQINTLDVEQIRKILHILVVGTIQLIKLSLSFSIYIKVFYRVERVSIYIYIYIYIYIILWDDLNCLGLSLKFFILVGDC